jgi:16S rRNA processing protein RimM
MAGQGATTAPSDLVELGRIVSGYGVRGWVKIQPHSSNTDVLRKATIWWLGKPVPPAKRSAAQSAGDAKPTMQVKVLAARTQGTTVVAQLDGINDRDQAESLVGCTVHVSKSLFPPAKADEYYWLDLESCIVYETGTQSLIGVVSEVLDNGAHAILRVQRLTSLDPRTPLLDEKGKVSEMLVPFVEAYVQHVDIQAKKIDTDWPLDF